VIPWANSICRLGLVNFVGKKVMASSHIAGIVKKKGL